MAGDWGGLHLVGLGGSQHRSEAAASSEDAAWTASLTASSRDPAAQQRQGRYSEPGLVLRSAQTGDAVEGRTGGSTHFLARKSHGDFKKSRADDETAQMLPLQPARELRYGLTSDQVPPWLRFPHLATHYRLGGDHWQCIKSMFRWHSETTNTWTMLAVNASSLAALVWVLAQEQPHGADRLPFILLFLSAFVHLPWSVGYHTFMPISPAVYNWWRRLDVSFIFIGSCPLTFALGFFIWPLWATLLCTAAAVAVTCMALLKITSLPEGQALDRPTNAALLSSIVFVYMTPMVYQSVRDLATVGVATPLVCYVVVFASLALSFWLYARCVPECYSHGTFDLVGRSHHIMHVLVGVAHGAEFVFILDTYRRYHAHRQA